MMCFDATCGGKFDVCNMDNSFLSLSSSQKHYATNKMTETEEYTQDPEGIGNKNNNICMVQKWKHVH